MFFRGRTWGLHPPKPQGSVARGSGSRKRMTIAAPLAPIIALCFCLNTTTTAAQASQTPSNPPSNQGQTQAQHQDVRIAPPAGQPAANRPQPAPPPEERPPTEPPTGQPG